MRHVVVARVWIDPASESAFLRREAALEQILLRHGGARVYEFTPEVRSEDLTKIDGVTTKSIVHVLEFPDSGSFGEYLRDPDRLAIIASGEGAPMRTEVVAGAAT